MMMIWRRLGWELIRVRVWSHLTRQNHPADLPSPPGNCPAAAKQTAHPGIKLLRLFTGLLYQKVLSRDFVAEEDSVLLLSPHYH